MMIRSIIDWFKRLLGFESEKTKQDSDQPRPLRQIAAEYFDQNPDAKDEVMKAYFAYHAGANEDGAHFFLDRRRDCKCRRCGRSRELVRWDELPPRCQNEPDIAGVILREEEKAFGLIEKATSEVPKLVAKLGMSGQTLAVLHHTHGYDPEIVSGVMDVPKQMLTEYNSAMETERERSRASHVKQVITAK